MLTWQFCPGLKDVLGPFCMIRYSNIPFPITIKILYYSWNRTTTEIGDLECSFLVSLGVCDIAQATTDVVQPGAEASEALKLEAELPVASCQSPVGQDPSVKGLEAHSDRTPPRLEQPRVPKKKPSRNCTRLLLVWAWDD
jgi:hypothetical protein